MNAVARKLSLIDLSSKRWQWTVLLFLAFIWGTSFILMKKGLQSYTSTQVAAFRLFFSFLFYLPLIYRYFRRITRQTAKSLIVVGVVGNGIPAFLFTEAQTQISSSLAGMLNSLVPFFALIIGLLFYKSKTRWHNVLGVFIGLTGALGLVVDPSQISISGINAYGLLVVLATIFYGINVNEVKTKLQDMNGLMVASLAFMFIGPPAGFYLLFSDFSFAVSTPDYLTNIWYVVMLALFSSVIAVAIFNILIKHTSAVFGASVTYVIPVFAIFWGIFDGESITILQFLFISLIMFGVYLVNKK